MKILEVRCDVQNYAAIVMKEGFPVFDGARWGSRFPKLSARLSDDPVGDFAYFTAGVVACNEHVLSLLGNKVMSEIEVLPIGLQSDQKWYLLNVVNVIDCLDEGRSEIKYFPDGKKILRIIKYSFREELVRDSFLFKIPQMVRTEVFATENFQALVDEHKLKGLDLRPVGRKNTIRTKKGD